MALIGEIKLWGGRQAPKGWRFCDGAEVDARTVGPLLYVIEDNYGWSYYGEDKVHLPNMEPVIDKDHRGESRYIICIEGEFPQY